MQFTRLPTGAKLPLIGLGTYNAKSDEELETALRAAIQAGYRLIDTAAVYENEASIGRALSKIISEGLVKREDLFIITKLANTAHSPADVLTCVEQQMKWLRVDYIDMYLIHSPMPMQRLPDSPFSPSLSDGRLIPVSIPLIDTWQALEKLYARGKLRAIGVSNFSLSQLTDLCHRATVQPMNLQIECHLAWQQRELIEFCEQRGITVGAYTPIGNPGLHADKAAGCLSDDPDVKELAKKYNKTPAQILLRFNIHRGLSSIPKSTNPQRIRENIDVFDFQLTPQEMTRLCGERKQMRLVKLSFAKHHHWFPFDDLRNN